MAPSCLFCRCFERLGAAWLSNAPALLPTALRCDGSQYHAPAQRSSAVICSSVALLCCAVACRRSPCFAWQCPCPALLSTSPLCTAPALSCSSLPCRCLALSSRSLPSPAPAIRCPALTSHAFALLYCAARCPCHGLRQLAPPLPSIALVRSAVALPCSAASADLCRGYD